MPTVVETRQSMWVPILFVLTCFAVQGLGAVVTYPAIPGWYANLDKPSWTPPNSWFGPVWTFLYASMAVAATLVVSRDEERRGSAVRLFLWHLLPNVAWSWLFFGLRSPLAGMIDIVILWMMIIWVIVRFVRIHTPAGLLLVPYLAWVSYAAALNASILLHN